MVKVVKVLSRDRRSKSRYPYPVSWADLSTLTVSQLLRLAGRILLGT